MSRLSTKESWSNKQKNLSKKNKHSLAAAAGAVADLEQTLADHHVGDVVHLRGRRADIHRAVLAAARHLVLDHKGHLAADQLGAQKLAALPGKRLFDEVEMKS